MTEPTHVFVYGTLRRGGRYHHLLQPDTFITRSQTRPVFDLFDLGPYPAMVAGGQTAVTGEIYSVDAHTLARLDALEEHPHVYIRTPIELEHGQMVKAYLMPREPVSHHPIIPSGDWLRR